MAKRWLFLLLFMAVQVSGCDGDSRVSPTAVPTVLPPHAPRGPTFSTAAELARAYEIPVFVPSGVPISSVETSEASPGELASYAYWLWSRTGSFGVRLGATGALSEQEEVKELNPEWDRMYAATFERNGRTYILIHEEYKLHPSVDSFQLVWMDGDSLLQLFTTTFGAQGGFPTIGPDALIQTAELVREFSLDELDSPDIVSGGNGTSDFVHIVRASRAASLLGFEPVIPKGTYHLTVVVSGEVHGYVVDLDRNGSRRLYPVPTVPDDEEWGPNLTSSQRVAVADGEGIYRTVKTESGSASFLFFTQDSSPFMIRDANGAASSELIAVAESSDKD